MQTHELRQEIIEKYGSIHAFCKAFPELTRATVYLVLNGKYAGKIPKQIERITSFLQGATYHKKTIIQESDILKVLQNHKCNHCRLLHKNNCLECKSKTSKEAVSVYNFISGI